MMLYNRQFAVLIGLLGVVFYSSKAIFVKLSYHYGIDTISLLFLRMLFALPIYLAINLFRKQNKNTSVSSKDWVFIVFLGFIGYYLSSWFDFEGLKHIDASLERIILFIYPTIVVFLSKIFLKTKITKRQIWAIMITYLGLIIIFSRKLFLNLDASEHLIWGSFLIFLCAISYAVYFTGSGKILPKIGTMSFTIKVMSISSCIIFTHYLLSKGLSWPYYPWQVYFYSFLMAVIATVLPSFMISESIRRLGADKVSVLASLGPVSTIILAVIFLGETLFLEQLIGTAVVLLGIYVISKRT